MAELSEDEYLKRGGGWRAWAGVKISYEDKAKGLKMDLDIGVMAAGLLEGDTLKYSMFLQAFADLVRLQPSTIKRSTYPHH